MAAELDVDALLDELEEAEEGIRASPMKDPKESSVKTRITRIKENPKPMRQATTFSTYNYNEQALAEDAMLSLTVTEAPDHTEPEATESTQEVVPDRRPAHRKHLEAAVSIPLATTAPSLARAKLTPMGGKAEGLRVSPNHPKSHESEGFNPFKYPLGFGRVEEEKLKEAKQKEVEVGPRQLTVRRATAMHSRTCTGIVPLRRWGHVSVLHRGVMYVFGGSIETSQGTLQERSGETNDFHQLAFDTFEWDPVFVAKGKAPAPRCGHSACVLGNRMVIFGGSGHRNKHYSDLHEFDFETQEWIETQVFSKKSSIPVGRTGHSAVVYGKRVFIFGGRSNKPPRHKEEDEKRRRSVVDPDVDKAEDADKDNTVDPTLAMEKEEEDFGDLHSAIHFSNELFSFDFKSGKWRLEKPQPEYVPKARSGHSAAVAGTKMYIMGGSDGSDYFGDVAEYCFDSGSWSKVLVDNEVPRFRHTMRALESSILQPIGDEGDGKPQGFLLLVCGGLVGDYKNNASHYLSVLDIKVVQPQGSAQYKRGQYVPIRCSGVMPKPGVTGHTAVFRSGSLYTFGGYSDNAASNDVHYAMLYDDILVEPYNVSEGMASLYKNGADWLADVCFESPDEVFYAHKCVLLARAPQFWNAMREFTSAEETDTEGSLRVDFIPVCFDDSFFERTSLPSATVFDAFLQYLYTGKLSSAKYQDKDLTVLEDIAVRHNITHLAEYLESIKKALAPSTATPTKAKTAVRMQFGMRNVTADPEAIRKAAQKRGEERLAADLKSLLTPPRLCGTGPVKCADVGFLAEGRVVWAHRAILIALNKHFRRQFLGAGERLTAKQKKERKEKRSLEKKSATSLDQLQQQLQLQEKLGAVKEMQLEKMENAKTIHEVITFVYTGECQVKMGNAWDLMKAANTLRLSTLRSMCESVLYQSLRNGESGATDMLELAASIGAYQLKQQCLDMIVATYTPDLLGSDQYQRLSEPLKREIDKMLVECGILPSAVLRKTTQKPMSVYEARTDKIFGEDSQVAVVPPSAAS